MILAVTGYCPSTYAEFRECLEDVIDLKKVERVIAGAVGATNDFVEQWCEDRNLAVEVYEPEFVANGLLAIEARNNKVVERAGKIVCFYTEQFKVPHLVAKARALNKRLVLIAPRE